MRVPPPPPTWVTYLMIASAFGHAGLLLAYDVTGVGTPAWSYIGLGGAVMYVVAVADRARREARP